MKFNDAANVKLCTPIDTIVGNYYIMRVVTIALVDDNRAAL